MLFSLVIIESVDIRQKLNIKLNAVLACSQLMVGWKTNGIENAFRYCLWIDLKTMLIDNLYFPETHRGQAGAGTPA